MSRAILEITGISAVDVTTNVNVLRSASIWLQESNGTTLLTQSVYAAASGGSPLTYPLSANSDGVLIVYAERPQENVIARIGSLTATAQKVAFRANMTEVALTTFDHINVMAQPYNAVGDGIVDDHAAITAAIAAMGDRDELYFPPGRVFLTSDDFEFNNLDHIRITGGTGSRIKLSAASKNALTFTGCTYVDIDGLALEGGNSSPIVSGSAPNAYGRPEHGIEIDATSSHVTIQRLYVEKFGGQGILSRAAHTTVNKCELVGQNPTLAQTQHSAILLYGDYSEATSNTCSLWSIGVHSSSDGAAPIHQRITDNILFSPTATGTELSNAVPGGGNRAQVYASAGKYAYIGSNQIKCYEYGYGIKVGFGAFGAVIESNITTGTVNASTKVGGGGGITVNYSIGAVVSGNTIDGSSLSVAWENLTFDPTGTVVVGNTICNAPHIDGALDGAILFRGIHGIIAYNTIQDAQNHGIALTDLSSGMAMPSMQIIGNNIRQVGLKTHDTYSAIKLGSSGGELFKDLKIFGNQAFGTGANPQMKYFIDASQANDPAGSTIEEFGNTTSGFATGRAVYHGNVTLQAVTMESPLSSDRAITSAGIVTGSRLISNIATGTAPLGVTSTTMNTNLTAENLGAAGRNSAWYAKTPLAAKSASVTTLVDATYTDVNALSLALGVGNWHVTGCIDFVEVQGAGSDLNITFDAILTRTGGTSSVLADSAMTARFGTADERATVSQSWVVVVTVATTTIKLRAQKTGGTGSSVCGTNSTLTAVMVGSA